ncbi:MAG TPA: chromosome segregation protein ScpA [Bacteroidetes bacterium]|nr:chromosome segregation protein ScpA [Bacteroidota bacterium]
MHRVHLRDFEGPLDLLLFFIRRDEVDVYDIPIARIADEYLEAVRLMQRLDLDEAAEFIYTAALLIQIKARMLLPRPPAEDGEEPEDPRAELVQRLLEYIQYREAGEQIGEQFEERQRRFTRGAANDERARLGPAEDEVTYRASVFDLLSALGAALERTVQASAVIHHDVVRETVHVDEQKDWLIARLTDASEPVTFRALAESRTKEWVIATFLAVLDLLRHQRLALRLGIEPEDFALEIPTATPHEHAALAA